MFILLCDFVLWIGMGLPIALLLIYIFSIVGHVFIGGPIWLWFTISLIGGFISAYGKFKENLRKIREESNA